MVDFAGQTVKTNKPLLEHLSDRGAEKISNACARYILPGIVRGRFV